MWIFSQQFWKWASVRVCIVPSVTLPAPAQSQALLLKAMTKLAQLLAPCWLKRVQTKCCNPSPGGGGDNQITGTCWTVRLAYLVTSNQWETNSKNMMNVTRGDTFKVINQHAASYTCVFPYRNLNKDLGSHISFKPMDHHHTSVNRIWWSVSI